MSEKGDMKKAIGLFQERGQEALKLARKTIRDENVEFKPLREALDYFMDNWQDVLHPALVSLACEAVGGNPESTTQLSAAIVLLAGGADVHDDIIDQSVTKGSKPTVFGKFGQDIAILTGDSLIVKGMYILHEACEAFSKNKKQEILKIISQAFFRISGAELKEASFRGKLDLPRQEYFEITKHKVAAGEASTRVGAIIGDGSKAEIEALSHYGNTLSVLMALRDDFIDIFEPDELKNRFKKECLPLPILLALRDDAKKETILRLLESDLKEAAINELLDIVLDSKEVSDLKEEMKQFILETNNSIATVKKCKGPLNLIINSTLEDI